MNVKCSPGGAVSQATVSGYPSSILAVVSAALVLAGLPI